MTDDPFQPLFASDLAAQVRESFVEMLDFGASVSAATQETIARFQGALKDDRDGPVIIIALAALQVREREIFASIRNAALELLQDGGVDKLITTESNGRNQIRDVLGSCRKRWSRSRSKTTTRMKTTRTTTRKRTRVGKRSDEPQA